MAGARSSAWELSLFAAKCSRRIRHAGCNVSGMTLLEEVSIVVRIRLGVVVVALAGTLMLGGCGTNPEVLDAAEAIGRAEAGIRSAESAGGSEYAERELGMAREKL